MRALLVMHCERSEVYGQTDRVTVHYEQPGIEEYEITKNT